VDNQQQPRRIWLPSPHNLRTLANDNWFHSLWLGTVGLFCLLPYMVVFQLIMPILTGLVRATTAIFDILGALVGLVFDTTCNFFLRILQIFLYGLFGYLNVVQPVEIVHLIPPGPGDDLNGPKNPEPTPKPKSGMHQP